MPLENAKEFLDKIVEDKALQERLTGKEPEEVLAAAKELGLECTREELEEAAKKRELDMDELAETAGGANIEFERSMAGKIIRRESPCTNPGGHQWVYTHHDEERNTLFIFPFFGTKGYNYFKCEYCNRTKRERV